MEDLEGSKKLVLELFVLLRVDIFAIQLDLFGQSIPSALDFFIMGSLLQLLCME